MQTHEYEGLRDVLSEVEEPLTAREILALLDDGDELDSTHSVATVLGRWAERGEVEVIPTRPYRYRLRN